MSSLPRPLALSDDQLAVITAMARPIAPQLRRRFLERVAEFLHGHPQLGDGLVSRACVAAQREFFDAPLGTESG